MSYGSKRKRSAQLGSFSSVFNAMDTTASIISRIVGNPSSKKLQYSKTANGISWSTSLKANKLVATAKFAAAREEKTYDQSSDNTYRLVGIIGRQETFDTSYLLTRQLILDRMTSASLSQTGTMCISKVEQFSEFHNQSNTTVKMWIYDLICKKDDCKAPTPAWSQGIVDAGAGSTSYKFPYSFPQASKEFNDSWDIIKVTRVTLDAGQSHVHNFDHYINKTISYDRIDDVTTFVAGYTTCTMIVLLGSLDNDQTTKTQIAYGASAVNMYAKTKLKYMIVDNNQNVMLPGTNQVTAFTVAQNTMLEDVDSAANFGNA